MTSYSEYLKKGNSFNKSYLAPEEAHAKYTKGTNPGHEFKMNTIKSHNNIVELVDKRITKTGRILNKIKKRV